MVSSSMGTGDGGWEASAETSVAFFGAVDSRPYLFLMATALNSVRRFHPLSGYFVLVPEGSGWTSLVRAWSTGNAELLELPVRVCPQPKAQSKPALIVCPQPKLGPNGSYQLSNVCAAAHCGEMCAAVRPLEAYALHLDAPPCRSPRASVCLSGVAGR